MERDQKRIEPCPFCGGPGEIRQSGGGGGYYPWIYVSCFDCDATGSLFKSEEEAIEAWNDRLCDGDNVALQVLCRAFDEDPADLMEEWHAFDKSGWLWWGRALGAFVRRKINALRGDNEANNQNPQ